MSQNQVVSNSLVYSSMNTPTPNEINILDVIYRYLIEKYHDYNILYNILYTKYIMVTRPYSYISISPYISPQLPITEKTEKTEHKLLCLYCNITGEIIHESIVDVREPDSLETIDQLIHKWCRYEYRNHIPIPQRTPPKTHILHRQ